MTEPEHAALEAGRRGIRLRADGDDVAADQPDPLASDPVARRLGLVDSEGRTLCRCLVGDPNCPHRPAEQPGRGATVADPAFRLNPAFAEACGRLHDVLVEGYRRALYVQARTLADLLAGRTPREPASYLLDAGIDVEAERDRLR